MARLPGDHSQVGWLPPSYVHYHFSGTPQPRSHRENFGDFGCGTTFSGSSPLMRGKHSQVADLMTEARLIPAHAGKTVRRYTAPSGRAAHPRSRGENRLPFSSMPFHAGSSPLTRGKLARGLTGGRGRRLIPAHAGKTGPAASEAPRPRADPRSYGENCRARTRPKSRYGSSPLTRGKPRGEGAPCVPEGLIPTHAGKTLTSSRRRR